MNNIISYDERTEILVLFPPKKNSINSVCTCCKNCMNEKSKEKTKKNK
jgi:hypothetical protein